MGTGVVRDGKIQNVHKDLKSQGSAKPRLPVSYQISVDSTS